MGHGICTFFCIVHICVYSIFIQYVLKECAKKVDRLLEKILLIYDSKVMTAQEVMDSYLNVSADYLKVTREVRNVQDCIDFQRDLEKLQSWSGLWLMKFNPTKCKMNEDGTVEKGLHMAIIFKETNCCIYLCV